MAATKRNAGLTSAVPRATLNDEELVSLLKQNQYFFYNIASCNYCKLWHVFVE